MAVNLLSVEVSDLCIGKPSLRSFPVSATVGEALSALKRSREGFLSVWSCDHRLSASRATGLGVGGMDGECRCVGKVCMVNIICFLCKEENIRKPSIALKAPVSTIIQKVPELVKHLEANASLLEAVNCILEGAQNLVIPSKAKNLKQRWSPKASIGSTHHNGHEFCWITQEDVARYFFNSIHLFSPIPSYSLESLNIIDNHFLAVQFDEPALSALTAIQNALATQTAVAVVDEEGRLIGEISPQTLTYCDETVAAAVATLSIGDLMAYIDCVGPPDDLVLLVKERSEGNNLTGLIDLVDDDADLSFSSSFPSSSSSDEEFGVGERVKSACRMLRKAEGIISYPNSTLAAIMIQALAHRVNHAWVIESDQDIVGIVTLANMLKVFRDRTSAFS